MIVLIDRLVLWQVIDGCGLWRDVLVARDGWCFRHLISWLFWDECVAPYGRFVCLYLFV